MIWDDNRDIEKKTKIGKNILISELKVKQCGE
jgi:hypothetical protein